MRAAGVGHVLFGFDLGLALDLDRADLLIRESRGRVDFKNPRRAPSGTGTRPRPLRVSRAAAPVAGREFETAPAVEIVLYDFGGASVAYSIPFAGELEDLVRLSDRVHDDETLAADARERIRETLSVIEGAVTNPALSSFAEDYLVVVLEPPEHGDLSVLWRDHAADLARILRAEPGALSRGEVEEATSVRLSYTPGDLAIVDWSTAILVGPDVRDEQAVLEFANVQLLEWRLLDHLLDRAVDKAWEIVTRGGKIHGFASGTDALRRIARMQADYAYLFEGVSNAMKLLGDQYLARLYRAASRRFHLEEWEGAIHRKLGMLNAIHEKLAAYATTRRMEILEWIIIVLIAVSIVVYFVPHG